MHPLGNCLWRNHLLISFIVINKKLKVLKGTVPYCTLLKVLKGTVPYCTSLKVSKGTVPFCTFLGGLAKGCFLVGAVYFFFGVTGEEDNTN